LFLSVDNEIIGNNTSVNLTFGNTYEFFCISKDSRPSIDLTIRFDDINLEELSSFTVFNVNKKIDCNSTTKLCTIYKSLSLTINNNIFRGFHKINCVAQNTTNKPFDIYVITYFESTIEISSMIYFLNIFLMNFF
jgi:hypothetical protein